MSWLLHLQGSPGPASTVDPVLQSNIPDAYSSSILISEDKKTPAYAGVKSSGYSEGRQNLREGTGQQTVEPGCGPPVTGAVQVCQTNSGSANNTSKSSSSFFFYLRLRASTIAVRLRQVRNPQAVRAHSYVPHTMDIINILRASVRARHWDNRWTSCTSCADQRRAARAHAARSAQLRLL